MARQAVHFFFKRRDVREIAVNAGEAYVSNVVELFELGHDHIADDCAGNLRFAERVKLPFDFVYEALYRAGGQRALFARFADAAKQLFAAELFAAPVFLITRRLARSRRS